MSGIALIGCILLLVIGTAVLLALLSTTDGENVESPAAFAFLPVPEDTPHVRAFLEYYASQVSWMDASVLQCVILVSTPQSASLCADLARDFFVFLVREVSNCKH